MSDKWRFLFDDERIVWQGSPRFSAAADSIGIGVSIVIFALVMAVIVDIRLVLSGMLGIGVIIWAIRRVQQTEYIVTTRAIWLKRGVINRTVRRIELSKVQNTAYSQPVTGSLFGYGTVTIEVAGGGDLQFRRIDNPKVARETITNRIGNTSERIPGSNDQWRSVLQLVREIRVAVE